MKTLTVNIYPKRDDITDDFGHIYHHYYVRYLFYCMALDSVDVWAQGIEDGEDVWGDKEWTLMSPNDLHQLSYDGTVYEYKVTLRECDGRERPEDYGG